MRTPLLLIAIMAASFAAISQDDKGKRTLSQEETKALLNQMFPDTTGFVRVIGRDACSCIDSVDLAEKQRDKKMKAFSGCIDKFVFAYQLAVKTLHSMTASERTIELNTNKNSDDYKSYYYDLERWLKDSCTVLNRAINSYNEEGEKSFSKNPDAVAEYNKGVKLYQVENYSEAIPFFQNAVKIDNEFAFAWDNLGICYRKTGKLTEAEAAYKSSLKVDPSGRTALQNLPIVYQLQNRTDDAIAAYNEMLSHYPGDPEVYYGIALIYLGNKNDLENALKNVCKAYNIYAEQKSPFRSDAEKVIAIIYQQMKKDKKEDVFNRILKENNIHDR